MATTDSDTHNVDRPLEWFDDERMNFMMSAFPSNREVNCAHWDSKMNFWKQCILRYCQHHHHIDMNRNQLKSILTRNGRQPLGLNLIIDHMLSSNQLIPTSEFQSSSMWIRYLKKSVTWFQNYFIGPPSTTNQWIVLPVIKVE
ncbi:uncharacterized protein TRIADDRAFT_58633 [Trichoplax adhaerens]|uniref:Uncharacterized protein n=1 Tax=Trichoplax adhaerens TaxID=10228 RepID=B3S386_TRIAD|nr:hypothetical protein TRIADDRAFT_58633 [Trichoplax adhaerens]EDV22746.1 hypothetical protein TRIADDRAFT_58633 [Trichoplax adhaerens]|eukprot:XP_002114612.1 hypothetical protein TRIADDRAFT_58633 [Trichoplax adhaerens]